MDWGDLRLFLAIARLGSVRAAAAELCVNQSTVNRRMDVLEHDLNLMLFDRTTRGFALTDNGHAIAAMAGPMRNLAEAVQAEADHLRRKLTGSLKITAPQALGASLVAPVIEVFRAQFPDIVVEYEGSERQLDLLAGEADVALRAGFVEPDDRYAFDPVGRTEWAVYCSKAFARVSGMPGGMDEIGRFPVVALGGSIGESPSVTWFMAHADRNRVAGLAKTVPNMADILHAGLGVGILPCVVGDKESMLHRCFGPVPELCSFLWIVTTVEARRSAVVASFVKVAVQWFAGHQGKQGLS